MKLANMNKEERSLLLYLETCMVDNRGRIDQRKLNDDDRHILEIWKETGFILTGRIHPDEYMVKMGSHWIELSDSAWKLAHEERRARSIRMLEETPCMKKQGISSGRKGRLAPRASSYNGSRC